MSIKRWQKKVTTCKIDMFGDLQTSDIEHCKRLVKIYCSLWNKTYARDFQMCKSSQRFEYSMYHAFLQMPKNERNMEIITCLYYMSSLELSWTKHPKDYVQTTIPLRHGSANWVFQAACGLKAHLVRPDVSPDQLYYERPDKMFYQYSCLILKIIQLDTWG